MQTIDTILADSIEENDLVQTADDTFEVVAVQDNGEEIIVVGDSLITGDRMEYVLSPDEPVSLMGA